MPAENLTLIAQWQINTYTITFDTNGGTSIDSISLNYNMPIGTINNPTKTGFIFNGWNESIPTHMPAANITLVAYWLKVFNTDQTSTAEGILEAIDQTLLVNKNAEVVIQFDHKVVSELNPGTLTLIETQLNKNQTYSIIDIKLFIKSDNDQDLYVTELNHNILVKLQIPENDRGYKNYKILRIHDGEVDILESEYDAENHTISFETDRFSYYVISYDVPQQAWGWYFLFLIIPLAFGIYFCVIKYRNKKPITSIKQS